MVIVKGVLPPEAAPFSAATTREVISRLDEIVETEAAFNSGTRNKLKSENVKVAPNSRSFLSEIKFIFNTDCVD